MASVKFASVASSSIRRYMGPSPKMVLRSRLWYCRRTDNFMAAQEERIKEDVTTTTNHSSKPKPVGAGCYRATGSAVPPSFNFGATSPPSFPSTLRSDAASHFGATVPPTFHFGATSAVHVAALQARTYPRSPRRNRRANFAMDKSESRV